MDFAEKLAGNFCKDLREERSENSFARRQKIDGAGKGNRMLLYTLLTVFSSKKEWTKDGRWNLRKALGLKWTKDEIKELREALGLTQAKFAKKLGVSRVVVAYWETGKKIPSRISEAKLEKLAQSLNCKLTPPKPAPTLEESLHQLSENHAWMPEAIKNLRRILGWTQAQLATALFTTQQIVAQWEAGKYRPSRKHKLIFYNRSLEMDFHLTHRKTKCYDIQRL